MVGSFGKARQLERPGEKTEQEERVKKKKTKRREESGGWRELERSDLNGAQGSTLRWG